MASRFNWSGQHSRLRIELFITSVVIYLAGAYGAAYNPEGIFPIKLVREIPTVDILSALRLLWLYFLISFIVKTFEEKSSLNAFWDEVVSAIKSLSTISSSIQDPDNWSDKIYPVARALSLEEKIEGIKNSLEKHRPLTDLRDLENSAKNARDKTVIALDELNDVLSRGINDAERPGIVKRQIEQLTVNLSNISKAVETIERDCEHLRNTEKVIEDKMVALADQLQSEASNILKYIDGTSRVDVDEFVKKLSEASEKIDQLQQKLDNDLDWVNADRIILGFWTPLLASITLMALSFRSAGPRLLNADIILISPPQLPGI